MRGESRRRGGRGRESMWSERSKEDEQGAGEAWPCDGQQKRKKKREREKGAHGHRKSGALRSHAKSSDGGVCSHPGDVATKRTRLPSNHRYRQ